MTRCCEVADWTVSRYEAVSRYGSLAEQRKLAAHRAGVCWQAPPPPSGYRLAWVGPDMLEALSVEWGEPVEYVWPLAEGHPAVLPVYRPALTGAVADDETDAEGWV